MLTRRQLFGRAALGLGTIPVLATLGATGFAFGLGIERVAMMRHGIQDIRLGPSLPAFITPNVLNVLVENFAIKPIAETAQEDLQTILA